jgi:hypothetical protein
MKKLLGAGTLGALAAWFGDPQSGARRRNVTRDRTRAFFRRRGRGVMRMGRGLNAHAYGLKQRAAHMRDTPSPPANDETLKAKIETELFRDADSPKGRVSVNVEHGIAVLRGQVDRPEQMEDLESRVRDVNGVRDVENLLHLPGTPAPMHQAHR